MAHFVEGHLQPYAPLLEMPPLGSKIYKVVSIGNFLKSLERNYLHFTRVDKFEDTIDSMQLSEERRANYKMGFERSSKFTLENYYDQTRERTYAFCASLNFNEHIKENYGNGDVKGKVCLEFDLGNLTQLLHKDFPEWKLSIRGAICRQIFSLSYGIVHYVQHSEYQRGSQYCANPIEYTYLKDMDFRKDDEFRVILSALGFGKFVAGGAFVEFPTSLQLPFNFRTAFQKQVITSVHVLPGTDLDFLRSEMSTHGITTFTF